MFNNLKVRTKMLSAFVVVVLITVAVGVTGGVSLNNLKNSEKDLYFKYLEPLNTMSDLVVAFQKNRSLLRDMILSKDEAESRAMVATMKENQANMEKLAKIYNETIISDKMSKLYGNYTTAVEKYNPLLDKIIALSLANKDVEAIALASSKGDAGLASIALGDAIDAMMEEKVADAKDREESDSKQADFAIWFMISIMLLGAVVAIVVGLILSNMISKPIHKIKDLMEQAGNGNLTVRGDVTSKDELGELAVSFNSLLEKTAEAMKRIWDTTKTLNTSSSGMLIVAETMAASSEETSSKTSVVSASVEEISSGMSQTSSALSSTSSNINMIASAVEEMSGTVRGLAAASEQTSAGVKQASNLVEDITSSIGNVSESAKEVSNSVNNVVTAVKEINISLNEVNKNCSKSMQITADAETRAVDTNSIIDKLNISSKQIGKIVGVINDIADQTNMLALNAAIEAAGAGEAGKGFAVVANEVKELAKQTAEATDEIGQQIESMQINMSQAVDAVSNITEVIKEITSITNTIAAAVTEQSATTSEISNAAVRAAEKVNNITNDIGNVSTNARNVARSVDESSKGVLDIARSAAELSKASGEVAMNSERASTNLSEITRNTQEITKGSVEIARNVQEINAAANEVAKGASDTNNSAKVLSDISNKLEALVKQFTV